MLPDTLSNEGFTLHEGPGLPRELQPDVYHGSSRGPSLEEEDIIDYSWQKEAACKGMDIDLFFLKPGQKTSQKVIDACNRCPVIEACLQHSLEREEYGQWANTNPKQRKAMRIELGIKLKPINYDFLAKQEAIESAKSEESLRNGIYTAKIKGRGRKKKEACLESDW